MLNYIIWDPSPGMFDFELPFLHRPILWYGFFFALGFFLGYCLLRKILYPSIFQERKKAIKFADSLTAHVVLGGVIGARLGDVLFYQEWTHILRHPLSVLAVWEGGLASHGGALGILLALLFFSKKQRMSFWRVVDCVVIPAALAGALIRIGNFFNQEILGIPTKMPWGVIFLHPVDGGAIVPRHPVQLYESLGYFSLFLFLLWRWRKDAKMEKTGQLSGLFLTLLFSFRFLIEFLKSEQSAWLHSSAPLTMGQILSLPFICLGVFLLIRRR